MSDPNVDELWSDDLLEFCVPTSFSVTIHYESNLMQSLAAYGFDHEKLVEIMDRMTPKIKMIERLAAKQMSGMLKGTLKYKNDEHSIDEWIAYLLDDAGDGLNYAYLLAERVKRLVDPDTRARKGA